MAIYTEPTHAGEHILCEAGGSQLCREEVTITGGNYPAGKVLGKITASGLYTEHDPSAGDGSETAAAILHAAVDASAADHSGVITARLTAVSGDALTWITGISGANKTAGIAALAANNIIVR
jgi:hypothetical protein